MGLDTNHLKLTVKQHLERSLFILKEPKQFFTTLFSGEMTLKEQVIPYFVLFSLLNITVRTILAIVNSETILFALHISIFYAVQQGLVIAALALLLPKIEQHTNLSASSEKYAALMIYSGTAGFYALLASNFVMILSILGLYGLYLIYLGLQPLVAEGKAITAKTYLVLLGVSIACSILATIVTSPFSPSFRSIVLNSRLSDDELLLQKIRELHDIEINKYKN